MFFRYYRETQPSFRFLVMGDSRGKHTGINESVFRTLLNNSRVFQPNFILFLGDMVHENSSTYNELRNWLNIVGSYYSINSCFPCIGNHDKNESAFNSVFNYLPNDQLQGYGRTVYYFDYLDTRFIILNSCHRNEHGKYIVSSKQLEWLENVLKNNTRTHCFVSLHVPPFPTGAHYGESLDAIPEMRDALWSVIDRYNVTTVFCGHEHNYSHRLINNSFSEESYIFKNSIDQIISGGAGAPLRPNLDDSRNLIKGPFGVYHYIIVDVIGNEVIFNAYDINISLLDSFSIER